MVNTHAARLQYLSKPPSRSRQRIAPRELAPRTGREQQEIVLALVVAFLVIQLSNTTPEVEIAVTLTTMALWPRLASSALILFSVRP
jgi:hypothetical protein